MSTVLNVKVEVGGHVYEYESSFKLYSWSFEYWNKVTLTFLVVKCTKSCFLLQDPAGTFALIEVVGSGTYGQVYKVSMHVI